MSACQNEPWGATWGDGDPSTDWSAYATRLGNIVLAECPRWLIFVEGVGNGASDYFCDLCFWGENLRALMHRSLPQLAVPERLVISPHLCTWLDPTHLL